MEAVFRLISLNLVSIIHALGLIFDNMFINNTAKCFSFQAKICPGDVLVELFGESLRGVAMGKVTTLVVVKFEQTRIITALRTKFCLSIHTIYMYTTAPFSCH